MERFILPSFFPACLESPSINRTKQSSIATIYQPMDDLLALFEQEDSIVDPQTLNNDEENENFQILSSAPDIQRQTIQETLATSIDTRVGIRMINRRISGSEMMDIISAHPYLSTPTLAAMSLKDLNQKVLLQPAAGPLIPANVCGKSNIVTVGIVFSNSGPRKSSNGNSFCVLTIGNLATGPAVSILLFGTAYNQYVKSAALGKVILIAQPRLIPPRQENNSSKDSTSISFSVSEERQLLLVADARDFGICHARTRGRDQQSGSWVDDAKRCHHYIDTRCGIYCKLHQKQANQTSGSTKGDNKLIQLRNEARLFPTKIATKPVDQKMTYPTINPVKHGMNHEKLFREPMSFCHQANRFQDQQKKNQVLLVSTNRTTRLGGNAGLIQDSVGNNRMKSVNKPVANYVGVTVARNPYQSVSSMNSRQLDSKSLPKVSPPTLCPQQSRKKNITDDWLHPEEKARKKQKQSRVNLDGSDVNGSVLVPKPSKIFQQGLSRSHARLRLPPRATKNGLEHHDIQQVLSKQRVLAGQLLKPYNGDGKPVKVATKETTKSEDLNGNHDLLFGSLGSIKYDEVLAASSCFATEIDAETYARARQVMIELEKEEEKKKGNNKVNHKEENLIKKQWRCLVCKRTFSMRPDRCFAALHIVQIQREIYEQTTTAEARMSISEKSVEDGGILLGQGLEWSR